MQKQQDGLTPPVYIPDTSAFEIKSPLAANHETNSSPMPLKPLRQEIRRELQFDHGVEFNEFMKLHQLNRSDIWQLIAAGELSARNANGKIMVYGTLGAARDTLQQPASEKAPQQKTAIPAMRDPAITLENTPMVAAPNKQQLQTQKNSDHSKVGGDKRAAAAQKPAANKSTTPAAENKAAAQTMAQSAGQYSQREIFEDASAKQARPQPQTQQPQTQQPQQNSQVQPGATTMALTFAGSHLGTSEIALLLDHLSLAKEENKEILRLTQTSMERLTKMTEDLISAKDQVIADRNSELDQIRLKMQLQELEVRKLKQDNEDLQMLARTLSSDH